MSGGGSSNASVEYPTYQQDIHSQWLSNTGTDTIGAGKSVTALMSAAMDGGSPYAGFTPVDVDTAFLGTHTLSEFVAPYTRLNTFGAINIESKFDDYLADDEDRVNAVVNADSVLLDEEIETRILPKLQASIIDLNAVQSTSYVLGEAIIRDSKLKMIAKQRADLRLQRLASGSEVAIRRVDLLIQFHKTLATLAPELARVYSQTRHDMDGLEFEMLMKDAAYDLTVFQYGVNVMASIAGAASVTNVGSTQKTAGGAIASLATGAATGAMVGGPIGGGIGAAIGLGAYYLS